jgi:hypothetical protein
MHDRPEALTHVVIERAGYLPNQAIVPEREATPELFAKLKESLKELPTLKVERDLGAVDVKLQHPDGSHVKSGSVMLERGDIKVAISIDPATRRFRRSGIAPGEYRLVGSSAVAGRGFDTIAIRPGDVTRSVLRLDGVALAGTTLVRFAVRGTKAREVKVRATDRDSGRVVFEGPAKVERGVIQVDVPFGRIHWDIDDENAKSCYDSDITDLIHIDPHMVDLRPLRDFDPDPPDWRFAGLGPQFAELARYLPHIGVNSIEELAAAEPEGLMHRTLDRRTDDPTPVHPRMLSEAITAARASLGITAVEGQALTEMRLGKGATFSRSFQPRSSGELELGIDLPAGRKAELMIQTPSGTERRSITGSETVKLVATPEDVAAKKAFRVSVTNTSAKSISGVLRAELPSVRHVPGFTVLVPSVEHQIESILEALAARNPGLGTDLPPAIMAPENIQMWIDRAKTFMARAGVCSMNDLGRFRLNPMRVLRTGAYVAPVVQPPNLSHIPTLHNYAFAELIQNSVLYYVPNDILHDTAVVLAGEWDIRGQQIIIGQEVRELAVIVGSIRHDAGSRISWEMPILPNANAYWPNPAPSGGNGLTPGANGQDGADGDQNPHPAKNGGADAVTPAPTVTMWILNASNGLPPMDLRGQKGGRGGRGQDGGRGGDGQTGLRADGTFFGGCCRGVGRGGNGGQGGDGGRGGRGGRGGDGGRVTLLTTAASISALSGSPPSIEVVGGEAGDGGDPGNPAPGGIGGPAGTADCETWCDEHPERRGSDGAGGALGSTGFSGDPGPGVVEDQIQILPITEDQWQQEFNKPHILSLNPYEGEPEQTVTVNGQNFDPAIDRVFFDGVNVAPVASATQATFNVPLTTNGGYHPVVIRPAGATDRRSNRALLHVIPRLDDLPNQPRWLENQSITLSGRAFVPGLQVLAEDRSVSPAASFALPVIGVTSSSIAIQVPGGPLGALRGVRRIVVRNPDGGTSRAERVIRIGDTIVVRVAAFRVVGATPGIGTTRTAAEIAALFNEGGLFSVAGPWQQARIVFRLVQPVATVTVADDRANVWPGDVAGDMAIFNSVGVLGAINLFFVRDSQIGTAYCNFGGGPGFIGDESGTILGPVDWQQVVAHEIGHGLCLRHVCDLFGEGPGTFFNRECDEDDDAHFLMYPAWNVSDGMDLHPGQIDPARLGATHFEDGKTAAVPATSLFQGNNTIPQCAAADTQN